MATQYKINEPENRLRDAYVAVRDVVRRRWITLLAIIVLLSVLGAALILSMKPVYEATAKLRLDPSRNPIAESARDQQASLNPESIQTEVSLLRSTEIAGDVVDELNLYADPRYVSDMQGGLGREAIKSAIVGQLLDGLEVEREELSYIIAVRYSSGEATEAARVANAFVNSYLKTKAGALTGMAQRNTEFFDEQLSELDAAARVAEAQVAQYRSSAGIVDSGGGNMSGTMADQQVGPLTSQLAIVELEAAQAVAAYRAALQQQNSSGIDTVSEVRSSPVIADLRRTRAEALREMGEVQARYGDRHPESIRVREELASIDNQIREESSRIVSSLRSDAVAAEARVASLRSTMQGVESDRNRNLRASVTADALQREADAKRGAYERMSQMATSGSQAAGSSFVEVDVIDYAAVPRNPASPNKPLLLALVFMASIAAGTGGVVLQEALNLGLRKAEDVETQVGLPLLAAVPKVASDRLTRGLLLRPTTSPFSESLRILRASLMRGSDAGTPKSVAFASALPSEGKSTTAVAFAGIMASSHARTLLLECDLRRATLQPALSSDWEGPGLVEVLNNEATVDEAIHPSNAENLDLLLVRTAHHDAADLFGNGGMAQLLAGLKDRYDMIVMDLPPLIGLADGRMVARLADTTVLAIKWDETPAKTAANALSALRNDGVNVAGAVYTMVDPTAEVVGGLYYGDRYSSYYQDVES